MDVLISWSKSQSRAIATLFYQWLPTVIPNLAPWMSDQDIDKGKEWFGELQGFLSGAKLCIIAVTVENVRSPWLYYEAGAIATKGPDVRVCPYLVGVQPSMLADGPLAKFQCTVATKDDTWLLIRSLNKSLDDDKRHDEQTLRDNFETKWPHFEAVLLSTLDSDVSGATDFITTPADELAGVRLSSEARTLLTEGAQDHHGTVFTSLTNAGRGFYANGKMLNDRGNARSEARWRAAWDELIAADLIEPMESGGDVYVLTDGGYRVAEELGAPANSPDATPQRDLDDNDIISLLEAFLANKRANLDQETFVFDEVDRVAAVPAGSAARLLEQAAKKWDYLPARKGKNTITFAKGRSYAPSVVNPGRGRMGPRW